jgi:hypothetical protein
MNPTEPRQVLVREGIGYVVRRVMPAVQVLGAPLDNGDYDECKQTYENRRCGWYFSFHLCRTYI